MRKKQYVGFQWGFFFPRGNFGNRIFAHLLLLYGSTPHRLQLSGLAVPGCWELSASLVLAVGTSVLEVTSCGLPVCTIPCCGARPFRCWLQQGFFLPILSSFQCPLYQWAFLESEHSMRRYLSYYQYCVPLVITSIFALALTLSNRWVQISLPSASRHWESR